MTQYQCPLCGRRACDSSKVLQLAKLSSTNEALADIVIKCRCCKNTLAIKITNPTNMVDIPDNSLRTEL